MTCERLTTNTYLNTPFTECSTQKHYTKPLCEFKGYHVSKKLILISYKQILFYSAKYAKSVAVSILYYPGQKTFLRIIKTFQYVHTLSMLFVYHMWKLYMIRKVQKYKKGLKFSLNVQFSEFQSESGRMYACLLGVRIWTRIVAHKSLKHFLRGCVPLNLL